MICLKPGCGRTGFRSYDGYCSITCANIHRPQNAVPEDSVNIDYWVRNAALSTDNIFDGGNYDSSSGSDFSGGGGSFDGGGSSSDY